MSSNRDRSLRAAFNTEDELRSTAFLLLSHFLNDSHLGHFHFCRFHLLLVTCCIAGTEGAQRKMASAKAI
eukprot:6205922-Pleurochrysis_carterae.AAC.1